jgi:hypothetical protein
MRPDSLNMFSPKMLKTLQLVGMFLWTIAFFLPACDTLQSHGDDPFLGWQCADLTLRMMGPVTNEAIVHGWTRPLMILSGWTNPLTLSYLVVSLMNRWHTSMRYLALGIIVCLIASWLFLFIIAHMMVLIGHFLWVAGILLILLPEWSRLRGLVGNNTAKIDAAI